MTRTTRPYLRAEARRRQLLDAAARLFARDGFAGMTMVACAAEADVSRRLVYDHFPDLGALYDAFFEDRFSTYLAALDEAIASGEGDLVASATNVFERLLAVSPDDQRALRLLVAGPGMPELEGVRDRFRSRVDARWLPLLRDARRSRREARAMLWALVSSFLSLAELVGRGEIHKRAAVDLATELVLGATQVGLTADPLSA